MRTKGEESRTHPMPILPDRYHVMVEASINSKNYSLVQQEYYDGIDERIKTITWFPGRVQETGEEHVIDLVTLGVRIYWYQSQDKQIFSCTAGSALDEYILDLTGHLRASNAYLGSDPDRDQFVGYTKSRGIRTEKWSRSVTIASEEGEYGYQLNSEFAVDPWSIAGSPIRATLTGRAEEPWGTRRYFKHVYDFIDFTIVQSLDQYFSLPLPLSFSNDDDLTEKCNATSIVHQDTRAALLALMSTNDEISSSSSSKKKDQDHIIITATILAAICGLFVGFFIHLLLISTVCSSKTTSPSRDLHLDNPSSSKNMQGDDAGISLNCNTASDRGLDNNPEATML